MRGDPKSKYFGSASKSVRGDEPHHFEPRQYGSDRACRWCGASPSNQIHEVKKK